MAKGKATRVSDPLLIWSVSHMSVVPKEKGCPSFVQRDPFTAPWRQPTIVLLVFKGWLPA